jgi:hypothetical protein
MAAILLHLFAARPRFFSIRPEIISLSRPDILCFQLYGKSKQLQDADPPSRLPGRSAESVNPTLLESRSSVAGRTASSRRRSQAIGLRPVSYQAAGLCRTIIEQYIREGGALIMIGGFMSFQGIEAKARREEIVVCLKACQTLRIRWRPQCGLEWRKARTSSLIRTPTKRCANASNRTRRVLLWKTRFGAIQNGYPNS